MASAALKQTESEEGTNIPGEGEDGEDGTTGQTQSRDFEAEAREHGWSPKEDFKGDQARWVDAETFMKRADEMMPLLKAQNARQKRELEAIRKDLKRATAHFEGAEKRAYDRAIADLDKQHAEAVEAGDVDAARAAVKEMGDLKPAQQPKHTKEEAYEAFDQFRDEQSWYDRGNLAGAREVEINARALMDRIVDKRAREFVVGEEPPPGEFFAACAQEVFAKYPELKDRPARQKPLSPVEGGNMGRPRGSSKTWDNVPERARSQYQRFIDRGITGVKPTGDADKDLAAARAYYAKTHDWEGYKE